MKCPICKNKNTAVVVYGHCLDKDGNEYPYDPRIYESGSSLPAWGNLNDEWPTRFCYKCRERFDFESEAVAFCLTYEDALRRHYEEQL